MTAEFFSLAGVWLGCRWDEINAPGDKLWYFLGCMDYQAEMALVVEAARRRAPLI